MANNPFFADTTTIAGVNAVTAALNAGYIAIYSGTQPADANQAPTGTLLVKLPLSATAFAPATAAGATGARIVTAVANPITSAKAVATGVAGYFALLKSGGTAVGAMGSVGTSGADLNLNSLAISNLQTVTCSSFTITQSE